MDINEMKVSTVALISQELQFVVDSQDVEALRDHMTLDESRIASDYDSFFVRVGEGEYTEIWGMVGTVPYLSKLISQIR